MITGWPPSLSSEGSTRVSSVGSGGDTDDAGVRRDEERDRELVRRRRPLPLLG